MASSEPRLNAEAMDQGSLSSLIAQSLKAEAAAAAVPAFWSPANLLKSSTSDPHLHHQPSLCTTCGVVIQNAANVEVHMKRHLGYKPYACSICSYQGYDEDDVRRHAARAHHGKTTPSIKFAPVSDMEKQLKDLIVKSRTYTSAVPSESALVADPNGPFAVLSIDTSYPESASRKSRKDKLMLGSITCELCLKSLPNLPMPVIQHLKSHMSCPSYACPSCGLSTESWTEMMNHASRAHPHLVSPVSNPNPPMRKALTSLIRSAFPRNLPQLPCALCDRLVEWSEGTLEEHVRHHSSYAPYKCGECGAAFSCTANIHSHLASEHPGVYPSLIFLPEVEDEFRQLPSLEVAFPILSSDSLESLEPEVTVNTAGIALTPSEAAENGNQEDTESGVSFSPSPEASTGKAMIECKLCGSSISRNMSCLIAHAKVHLAYKPLHCEYCSFKHFAMSKVRRHTARVHPNKPVKVSYHQVPDITKQLKEMKTKCFGSLATSTTWGDIGNGRTVSALSQVESVAVGVSGRSPTPSDDSGLPANGFSPSQANNKHLDQLVSANGGNNRHTTRAIDAAAAAVRDAAQEAADLNGMGKKICLLCNTYIANNPSSFDNHACKHLDYKPYHCQYCQYQSYIRGKVTRHIQQVHSGYPIKIAHRPLPGVKDKIASIKLRCFPFLATAEGGLSAAAVFKAGDQADEVPCLLCNDATTVPASETAMDEHIHNHIVQKFYHCPVCTYQTTFLIRAKQHVHSAHPNNQETRILCCPPDGLAGLRNLRLKAFGASAWAKATGGGDEPPAWDEEDDDDDDDQPVVVPPPPPVPPPQPPAAQSTPSGRITCSICRALLSNQPAAISSHVRNHLEDYKPYQCAYCSHQGPEEADVKEHILSSHKSVPLNVRYNPQPQKLARMADLCFPEFKGEMGQLMEASAAAAAGAVGNSLHVYLQAGGRAESSPATPATGTGGNNGNSNNSGSGSTLLKKLICQLCKNTIADNPKSVGIHVKNHLNYKPYRCPFCRYMSCEQSKARRHVEHVHSVSGDMVEIHAEEGIKERISEMKARCFPHNASAAAIAAAAAASAAAAATEAASPPDDPVSMVPAATPFPATGSRSRPTSHSPPPPSEGLRCQLCQELVALDQVAGHLQTHQGPFQPFKCPECPARFPAEDATRIHLAARHPAAAAAFPVIEAAYWTLEGQLQTVREAAFPQLAPVPGDAQDSMDSDTGPSPAKQPRLNADGKLVCKVCEQWVSCNPNSLDVHAKTHLAFKQYKCGHCTYRSCISGKVKRHLDNVHRGLDSRMTGLTELPGSVKQIITDMRTACFPQLESGPELSLLPRSKASLNRLMETLKTRLVEDLTEMGEGGAGGEEEEDKSPQDKAAALEAAAAVVGPSTPLQEEKGMMPSSAGLESPMLQGLEEEDEDSLCGGESPSDSGGLGKLQCQLCRVHVADNPSSLGLHVRNHLDYKPFSCNLCDYKSCIQAKVKRHLRNVHKCNTLEMTYAPETDIRLKVQDMKSRCFPRIVEAAESAQNGGLGPLGGYSNSGSVSQNYVNEVLDSMMGNGLSAAMALTSVSSSSSRPDMAAILQQALVSKEEGGAGRGGDVVECRLCARRVRGVDKEAHARSHHGAESEWHCSECGFGSFLEERVREHAESAHLGQPAQPVRFDSGPLTPESLAKLLNEAFAPLPLSGAAAGSATDDSEEPMDDDGDDDDESSSAPANASSHGRNVTDGPRYICHKCGQAVSMYASSLYVHVKNHMGYKPYGCKYCDYRSPVKSKVRRHIGNAHKGQPLAIDFSPQPGIESQIARVKKECFPDVTTNGPPKDGVGGGDRALCNLCKADVPDSPPAKSAHAKTHLDPKPFHCGFCSFAAAAKPLTRRHISSEHPGQPMRITFRPEEEVSDARITETVELCFGSSRRPNGEDEEAPKAEAKSERVRLGPAFREWHCPYCTFADTSKYNVKGHCVSAHPGRRVDVSDVALSHA